MKHYEDLLVWQKAMDLVVEVYELTRGFPTDERFGLCSQMRRAAVSIPSNIAEGQGRRTAGEFLNLLSNAKGSLNELETQLKLSQRLDYCETPTPLLDRVSEVGRLLNGLSRSLER